MLEKEIIHNRLTVDDQVSTLDQSERLKELGIHQESLFYWVKTINGSILIYGKDEDDSVNEHISAFTVAELGVIISYRAKIPYYSPHPWSEGWCYQYGRLPNNPKFVTEAEARAAMVIYLIEQGKYE